jgi:hypothetical protein
MSCQFLGRARLLVERPYRNLLIASSGDARLRGGPIEGGGRKFGEIYQPRLSHVALLLSLEYLSLTELIRLMTNA